jgi:hypothetical protein
MPKDRIEDIPAEDADPDDRTGAETPVEVDEPAEPPDEAQDVSEEQLRRMKEEG